MTIEPGLQKATLTQRSRFSAGQVLGITGVTGIGVAIVMLVLADTIGLYNQSTAVAGSGTPASLYPVTPARFAILTLFIVGWILIVAGLGLAMADMTVVAEASVESQPTDPDKSLAADGAGALLAGAGELIGSITASLKGLKTSTAAIAIGAAMMIAGGAVAWRTIPDTKAQPGIAAVAGVSIRPTDPSATPVAAATPVISTPNVSPTDSATDSPPDVSAPVEEPSDTTTAEAAPDTTVEPVAFAATIPIG